MTRASSPQSALQKIPGWESASWKRIDGGITNRVWVVESDGSKGLLKLDEQVRGIPFADRCEEARVQEVAAAKGLANRVLFASETVILTEYRDGTVWVPESFDIDDNLVRLAHSLKRLHALPPVGSRFDAIAAAERYLTDIGDADSRMAEQCIHTIRATPAPRHLRCCHNDLVAENILENDGIGFLDWEYAADNDPLFDLATIVAHHGLSIRQENVLLDAYFDGDAARWKKPLAEQVLMYKALCWLWNAARA